MNPRMSRLSLFIVLFVGLAVLVGPLPSVWADEAAEKAKMHNAAARKLFNLGQFKEAAEEYRKAYKAKAVPEFLHNMGQCYKRLAALEYLEKAVFYFESYLANAPDTTNRQEVEEEITELKQQIEKLRQAQVKSDQETSQVPEAALEPAPPQWLEKPSPTHFYKRWWFWTVVGVVIAGATTATVVALQPEDANPVTGTMPPGEIQFD